MSARPHYNAAPRISRLAWVFLVAVGVVLIVVLFSIKTRALESKSRVAKLERVLDQERAEVRMIKAEIAHLENPDRLRNLAEKYLNLQPTDVEKTLTLEQAVQTVPKRNPLENGTP